MDDRITLMDPNPSLDPRGPSEGPLWAPTATVVEFTVFGDAQPAGSKSAYVNRKTGRAIVTDANKKSAPWKTHVRQTAAEHRPRFLLVGALRVELRFFRPRPKGHFGARGNVLPSAPVAPATRPDVLKLARGVEDSLTGIVWRDDAQITEEMLVKAFGEPARVEVRVVALEAQPEVR